MAADLMNRRWIDQLELLMCACRLELLCKCKVETLSSLPKEHNWQWIVIKLYKAAVLHIDRNPFTSYSFQFLDCVSKYMVDRYGRLIYSTQFHLIFIVCIKGGCCIPFHHIVFVRPQSEQSTDCLLLASQKILSSSLTSRMQLHVCQPLDCIL